MFEYNKSNLRLVVATCWIKLDTRLIHHFLKLTLQHYIAFRVSGSCPHQVNKGPRQKEKKNRQYWRRCLSSYLKPFLKCSRSIQGKIMSSIEWITLILVTVETVNWFLFTFSVDFWIFSRSINKTKNYQLDIFLHPVSIVESAQGERLTLAVNTA